MSLYLFRAFFEQTRLTKPRRVVGTKRAALNCMTLPYPYEIETGQLRPRARAPRAPFDVGQHLDQAIRVDGAQLQVFGVRLDVAEAPGALATMKQFQSSLTARFQNWRPNADAATWELFGSQARAELAGLERADADTLGMLLLTVSGL
jgi:hypothetical protein